VNNLPCVKDARVILRRLGLEGRSVPAVLEDFIDRHVGKNRQLTCDWR